MSYRTDKTSYGLSRGASFIETKEQRQIACPHHQSTDWWHARLTELASAVTLSLQPVQP
jgi:hypothetical protein